MCCHDPMGRHWANEPDTCCHVHAEDLPSNTTLEQSTNFEEFVPPGWTAQVEPEQEEATDG